MRTKQLIDAAKSFTAEAIAVLEKAQSEYANPENAFEEFEETARLVGITPEQVWAVYFHKHVRGIMAHVRGQKSQREKISGRRSDALNYLVIAEAMDTEPTKPPVIASKPPVIASKWPGTFPVIPEGSFVHLRDRGDNEYKVVGSYKDGALGLRPAANRAGTGYFKATVDDAIVLVNVAQAWTLEKLAKTLGVSLSDLRGVYRDTLLEPGSIFAMPGATTPLTTGELRGLVEQYSDRAKLV